MSNIYFKVTIEKNRSSQNFDFLTFKKLSPISVFGELQPTQNSFNFKTSCCNFKIRSLGAKLCVPSLFFNFESNYDVLKSKSSYILLIKNINFNENETEAKLENIIYSFKEKNLPLLFI